MSNICTVTISGHAVTIQEGSLKITSRVDDKDKATFTVIDSTGTAAYVKGQPVKITDNQLGLLFSGFINKPTATNLFPSATTMWSMDCVNKFVTAAKKAAKPTSTTGKRHRGGKHKNQHSGTIAANQIKEYMEPEGVTGNFGLDWTELQSDWQSGTLSGVAATTNTSTGNPGAGDLELALSGPQLTFVGAGAGFAGQNGLTFTGYASSGYANAYTYRQIWSGSQVITSATDYLQYDVWIASTSPQIKAGVDLACSDGTTLGSSTQTDQQGILATITSDLSGLATDTWYTRTIGFPAGMNGKTITSAMVALGGANEGTYTAYFRNISYNTFGGGLQFYFFGPNTSLTANIQVSNIGYTNVSLTQSTVRDKKAVVTHTLNIGAANIIQSTKMAWTDQIPTGCVAIRETSIDGGASWQQITNGGSVPNLLPGMVVTGRTIMYRDTMIRGNDPSSAFSVFGPNPLTINQAYQATKSDTISAFTTSTDFSGGTLTNLVSAGSNGVTLNGIQRNWDDANFGNQTQYGSIGSTVLNKQFQLSANSTTEGRSRLDFAGNWQNFTAEVDFVFSDANTQCGFVYRTGVSNWQNNNNTFAYTAMVSATQVILGRGTNSSSGSGTFTGIGSPLSLSLSVNSSHRLKVVVSGNNHQVYVDNVLLINQNDSTYPATGYLGLRINNAGAGGVQTGAFDNFGVAASLSGTWQSPSINIAGPGTYGGSLVQWDVDGLPDSTTSIAVQTSIDGGVSWQSASNGGVVSGLTSGQSLTGKTLLLKATLAANNAPVVPTMNGISVWILGQYSSTGSRSNAPMVWDSVTRLPVVSGWGNASNGEAYTQTGTATTATTGSEATIANTSGDVHMVPAAPSEGDEDGSVRFKLSANTISAGIELRYVDNNNFYRLLAGQNSLSILFYLRGVAWTLKTATPTISTGASYWMRFQVIGSGPITLNGRVWLDGTAEPINTWNVTASQ